MESAHANLPVAAMPPKRSALWLTERDAGRQSLVRGWVGLVLAAALATAVSAMVIEIQAGLTGYLTGEGHWSRARLEAQYHLQRYASGGQPAELALARKALDVQLGDRDARLAMERRPIDVEVATRGFERGRNNPDNVPRLIRTYRYFREVPFFAEAIQVWRSAEPSIFRLTKIADELEAHWRTNPAQPPPARLTREIEEISHRLEPIERRFADILLRGADQVRVLLLVASGLLFAAMAILVLLSSRATIRNVRAIESRFRAAFQQSSVGMAKLAADGTLIAANEELASMLQRSPESLAGTRLEEWLVTRVADDVPWMHLRQPIEREMLRANGTSFWCRITSSEVEVADGSACVFLILEDVTEAHQLTQTLAFQASHDALTGLINRREIERRLAKLLREANEGGPRHCLCLLDLDQFKVVNDSSSHAAGDEVLVLVANTLPLYLGFKDWIGRLGGDEFVLLLHGVSLEDAEAKAKQIVHVLADTYLLWEGRHFPLTASIGLVGIDAETPSADWLLNAADTACYVAKSRGGNCVQAYVVQDEQVARRHDDLAWIAKLRTALQEDRLELYAQRIESLQDAVGPLQYEVLVRLIDANGRVCTPGMFMPAAERYGLATAVDMQVLALLVRELSRHPRHLDLLELCHVNVSGQSVMSEDFLTRVVALLDAHPCIAHKLCFELTETASIDRPAQAGQFIDAVHARGCQVALDDFGNGVSSFAYHKTLSVDIVKIDGLFVRTVEWNSLDRAIVAAITSVARSQSKKTVAEWVENDGIRACLRDLGVDAGQGYGIHVPVPLRELIADTEAQERAA